MAERIAVEGQGALNAIGPYSLAVRHGSLLFCSGMLPMDPSSGELVVGSLADETEQCLRNLAIVCDAGGSDMSQVLRTTIYTTMLEGFAEINEAYGGYFSETPPARATVGVAELPKGARVEIDAIVAID